MTNSYGQVPTKETYFYEFDVFLIDTRVAVNNSRRWDEGIIPFVIENGFSWDINRAIAVAMRFWKSRTCIKFVARDETQHSNYLTFIKSDRCESQLGRHQKGANIVFISDDCHPISIGREMGHAIGLVFSGESGYLDFIDDPHWGVHFECPRNNKLKPIPECGDTFIGPTGLIMVPDQLFESSFTKCEWRIYGSRSDKIVLEIEGLDVYESSKCLVDYLKVIYAQ
ncbi:GSCOCG00003121001-RA-CDS [Cotesia congregata]|nr:GSCOCG00003121001-RA-CDS [Cotesia congregata]